MSTIISETKTLVDGSGNVVHQIKDEKTIQKDTEPDYIKIYTNIWFDFKRFPQQYRELFLQLAIRMTYCNSTNLKNSQIVYVIGSAKKDIMEACGWKTINPLTKGLKALCDCKAIQRVDRGVYQINPEFAGKGPWRYNNNLKQGGIKDLVTTFSFAEGTVDTVISYNDDYDSNCEDDE